MWESFRNWDLAPLVMIGVAWFLLWLVNAPSRKEKLRRQANCPHDKCGKIDENTTYDIDLNPTHTTTLKCLNCEKIIEVKK